MVEAGASARARGGNLVLILGANLAKCLNNTKNGASFFFLVAISRIVCFYLKSISNKGLCDSRSQFITGHNC